MTKPWVRRAALAVLVVAASAGCGADKKPSADPAPTPTATATAPASSTPSATPSPPPEQPRGAYGVTYDILNWEQYADDPAVLAWKQTTEAAGGSMNRRTLLPALRQGSTPSVFKIYLRNVQDGWANEWHVRPVAKVRIKSSTAGAKKTELQVCLWDPSTTFYKEDGSSYSGDLEKEWTHQILGMTLQGPQWRVSEVKNPGKCQGLPQL